MPVPLSPICRNNSNHIKSTICHEISVRDGEIKSLRREIEEKDCILSIRDGSLSISNLRNGELAEKNTHLEGELHKKSQAEYSLQVRIKGLEATSQYYRTALGKTQVENSELRTSLEQSQAEVTGSMQNLRKAFLDFESLRRNLQLKSDELGELQKKRNADGGKIESLTFLISEEQTKRKERQAECDDLKKQLEDKAASISQLRSLDLSRAEEFRKIQDLCEANKTKHQEERGELERRLQACKTAFITFAAKSNEINELQRRHEGVLNRNLELKAELERQSAVVKGASERISRLYQQIEEERTRSLHLEEQNRKLTEEAKWHSHRAAEAHKLYECAQKQWKLDIFNLQRKFDDWTATMATNSVQDKEPT